MNNKTAKNKLIKKYGKKCFIEELGLRTKEEIQRDLFKYKKNKRKELMALTFHHIRERSRGGDASEENGAILRNINHIWFNRLPKCEQDRINKLFIDYKNRYDIDNNKSINHHICGGIISTGDAMGIDISTCKSGIKLLTKDNINNIETITIPAIDDYDYNNYITIRRQRERNKPKWQGHMWNCDNKER